MIATTPQYNTILFGEVWESIEEFKEYINTTPFKGCVSDSSLELAMALLTARYCNNPIANLSIDQFKLKFCAVLFQYGPTWEKRLEIQKTLRGLTEEDISMGSKVIYNHAYNPSTEPATSYLDGLPYINEQNVNNYKKGKIDAYASLWELLRVDVSEDFINKFKKLFKIFVRPENPLLFYTEEED